MNKTIKIKVLKENLNNMIDRYKMECCGNDALKSLIEKRAKEYYKLTGKHYNRLKENYFDGRFNNYEV